MYLKKSGFGIYEYKDINEKYEGNFEQGLKMGSGVYYFRNGDKFVG